MHLFDQEWQRITRLDDQPVLRNLLITQGYHELSRGFARMLGPENVTWFSFASWSSKTVGWFLQDEHLPDLLRARLELGALASRLQQLDLPFVGRPQLVPDSRNLLELAFVTAVHDMRRFLAKGNTEVFRELAPVFAGFLACFDRDVEPDPDKLERFLASLRGGPSAPDDVAAHPATRELALVARGGQAPLREAVKHFYHAKFEPDAKRKAERILLANAHIGVHEQTRLQTYILGALDAPVRSLIEGATPDALAKRVSVRPPGAAVTRGASWVSSRAHSLFRRFATDRLLTLKLPDSSVRLGRDLRAAPGHPLFPKLLEEIEHPELGSFYAQYAPAQTLFDHVAEPHRAAAGVAGLLVRSSGARTSNASIPKRGANHQLEAPFAAAKLARGTCGEGHLEARPPKSVARWKKVGHKTVAKGTAAEDWASLDQRMRFILELFRSRQQNQRLLEPTFSDAQVAALKRGAIPSGPLT